MPIENLRNASDDDAVQRRRLDLTQRLNQRLIDDLYGREHQPESFCAWMAGGGVKGGLTYGETEHMGYAVVDGKVHIHDLHAATLHLLGLDRTRLTWNHLGRDFRLTDAHGSVVKEIPA